MLSIPFVTFSQQIFPPDDGVFHYYQSDSLDYDLKSPCYSHYGYSIPTKGEFRILNLFINIYYDQSGNRDPIKTPNEIWPVDTIEGINRLTDIPEYLSRFMDSEILPNGGVGSMTRLYRESSFDNLILLGDFVIVNIKQSRIPKTWDQHFGYSMYTFALDSVINEAIRFVNDLGGLDTLTLHGYNQISDYDKFAKSSRGLPKPMNPNGKIDFLQVFMRNTTFIDTTFVHNGDTIKDHRLSWGTIRRGQGYGSLHSSITKIKIGNNTYEYDLGTRQCIGDSDISKNINGIAIHEFSHTLFGGNNFHTSGGNHYTGGGTNTFFGLEGGYGLMGASNSGLVSCNGYERWRMNWTHQDPAINPTGNPIQARHISNSTGVPSDIKKEDGPKSFVLRDFVTYGDVVRIKLPYQDNGASNQYIWLENHQIGRNGKLDYLDYSIMPNGDVWTSCRPMGTPGVYSYIQVGKDTREGYSNVVYPWNETDNLRIISAEGNWDFLKKAKENPQCVRWDFFRTERRQLSNPLSGYQDQTEHFFEIDAYQNVLRGYKEGNNDFISIKYNANNQLITKSLPFLGDNDDAFTGTSTIGIGTNPSPANVTTHYVMQYTKKDNINGLIEKVDSHRDNNHVYISGLKIVMTENPDHTFRVDVSWNDYDVSENVRWAGNIVLKEKVILKPGKTITLDQSLTPNQITRDPLSNLFVKPTVFRCDEGSEFHMEDYSIVRLTNKSTLVLKTGSRMEIGNDASLIINSGDTLKVEPCAKLIIKGNGRLVVNSGGVLCISPGAIVATDKGMSNNIFLNSGFIIPSGYIHPNQVVPPTTTISGNVTWSGKTYHVNSLTVNSGAHLTISNSTIRFGQDFSKAVIKPGGRITVSSSTLSNSCGDTWSGIYVEGDRTKTQTFANQGVFILQNNTIIENARDAVHVRGVADNWWGNGGIIQATNATFRNNWRNVQFNSYEQPSNSWFNNSTFETNSQTIHNEHTNNVSIWNMQGITFTNCTFKDTRPNIDYHTEYKSRNGILSSSASYIVDDCNFEGMKYGIYATSSVSDRTLKVYDSDFSSYNGIYFSDMNNSHVVNNTFFVKPGYMYSGPSQETYGLYLENSHNFEVTGNNFSSTGISAPCYCNSYGVIARNTGTITHEIYRNDFSGFQVPVQAIGQNRADHDLAGLQIRCNRFSNTHYSDIMIVKDHVHPPSIKQGIKQQQGATYTSYSNTSLGGNIFTNNKWYHNYAEPIGYYHHNTQSHPNLVPSYYTTNKITLHQRNHNYTYAASCPERQITRSTQLLLAEMEEGLTGQRDAEIQLLEMTDGGNTQLMLQHVEMAGEADAFDTYRHMMKTSPWLSEEVLVAVAGKQEGFNHAMIRDILVANPQAAKSEQVQTALENRKEKFSAVMMAQIEAGKEKWGEMEILQHQIAGYITMYELALNAMIRNHMHEGGKESREDITNLLLGTNDIRYQYWLAELYYSWGDYTRGAESLQSIGNDFDLDDEWESYNHQVYLDYYALLSQWTDREEYPGLTGLPEPALEAFEKFVNTGHRVSGKALAILLLNESIDYREPIYYPEEEELVKKTAPAPAPVAKTLQTNEGLQFRVFPNPGKDFITFDWCMDEEPGGGSRIGIYNTAGIQVHSIGVDEPCNQILFSLENLQGGNYIARFVSGTATRNISFVVSK